MNLLILFFSLTYAFKTYSPQEAFIQCSSCLSDDAMNRFCFNQVTNKYTCCNMAENSILCNPGPNITCSDLTPSLARYRFCPSNSQACDSDESIELFRSEVPLLSNLEDGVDVYEIPPGSVCVYEVNISGNKDSSEILEIEVMNVQSAKIGIDFIQLREDGSNLTVDGGFWSKDNCTMEVNCTVNMRGKHVYYLSGVQSLYMTVISENSTSQYDIDFILKKKTTSVTIYLASSFILLAIFAVAYSGGVDWMRQQMDSGQSLPDAESHDSQQEEPEAAEGDPLTRRSVNKHE